MASESKWIFFELYKGGRIIVIYLTTLSTMTVVSSWDKVILANVVVKTPAWKEDANNIHKAFSLEDRRDLQERKAMSNDVNKMYFLCSFANPTVHLKRLLDAFWDLVNFNKVVTNMPLLYIMGNTYRYRGNFTFILLCIPFMYLKKSKFTIYRKLI